MNHLTKTQKFHQRHVSGLLGLNQSQSFHNLSHCIPTEQFLQGGFVATIPVKLLLEVKCGFKTSKPFVKLLSVLSFVKLLSVPDTRGLYSVHVVPFFELGFFLIAVSMTGCLADEFVDGKPQFKPCWYMLFLQVLKLADASYSQQSQTIKPLYGYSNLTRQHGNCILQR